MTKREIIDTVLNRVKEGAKVNSTQFHPKQIESVISQYRSQFLKKLAMSELDYYAKQYTISLSTDGTNGRKIATLPVRTEDINTVSRGIVSVTPATGEYLYMYPITEREIKLTNGLECNQIVNRIGYVVKYDRIEFDSFATSAGLTSIRAMIIPTFDEYASTDEVPLGKFEKEIIELTTNYLLGVPAPDLKNN